jgi:integrase
MTPPRRIPDAKDPEIFRIGKQYYYRGTPVPGLGRKEIALNADTRGLAIAAKKKLLLSMQGASALDGELTFYEVADHILNEKQKHRRANTYEQAFFYIRRLKQYFGYFYLSQITDAHWDLYVGEELKKKNRLMAYDRRFMIEVMKFGAVRGQVKRMPNLRVADPTRKKQEIFKPEEVEALLAKAEGNMYGLILGMYKMGFRPAELLRLTLSRVNFEKNTITLRKEDVKANPRTVHMNSKLREWLLKRSKEVKGRYLFPSRLTAHRPLDRYNKQWKRLIDSLKMRFRPPYALRHSFATEAAKRVREGKLSIAEICQYMGTSIVEFERTYLHIDGEDTKHVAQIMEWD